MHHTHSHSAAPQTDGVTIHWAGVYDRLSISEILTLGRIRAVRRDVIEKAGLRPGERVLDVGTGPGYLALLAKEKVGPGGYSAGIDAAPEMIEVARGKARKSGLDVDFQAAVIEELPFPDASFDVVLSSLMMHHLPGDLKRRGLAEVRRVLRPGGRLVILDMKRPETGPAKALMPMLLHRSMPSGIQDLPPLLAETGFERIELSATRLGMLGCLCGVVR
jgi:ubiquinone/menaquinone biosynthesis C-methylase UbiE